MDVGQPVEVFSRFENQWSDGFEVADVRVGGYAIRRRSDGWILPNTTSERDLRPIPLR